VNGSLVYGGWWLRKWGVKDMVCVKDTGRTAFKGSPSYHLGAKKTSIANPVEDCYACFGDCLHYIECMRGKL
jgi:hypothetical protein